MNTMDNKKRKFDINLKSGKTTIILILLTLILGNKKSISFTVTIENICTTKITYIINFETLGSKDKNLREWIMRKRKTANEVMDVCI